jgi:phosphomannomutase
VLKIPYIDRETIWKRKFKVVLDCINGSGGVILPRLLRTLGCEVIEVNCDVSGVFARLPEPVPENLNDVCRRVKETRADMGIVVDPDADRLVLITEKGEPFGEEYTITSVIKYVLEKERRSSTVVVNLSTTRAVDDVAGSNGAKVVRTPVGEINVAQKMKECNAIVGGEGSGGVILPAVHYGRDAIVGIGIILQQLAEFGGTLSGFKATLPQYSIIKSKVGISGKDARQILERMKDQYAAKGRINTEDGVKIDFPGSWVHLRASNTEPIIRIIAEATAEAEARALVRQFSDELQSYSQ